MTFEVKVRGSEFVEYRSKHKQFIQNGYIFHKTYQINILGIIEITEEGMLL